MTTVSHGDLSLCSLKKSYITLSTYRVYLCVLVATQFILKVTQNYLDDLICILYYRPLYIYRLSNII